MKVEVIPKDEEQEYPCIVINDTVGDGEQPTIYLKPSESLSIVLVLGYMGKQMGWRLGHVLDSNDPEVASDLGVGEGEPIHEDLPLYDGQVILKN